METLLIPFTRSCVVCGSNTIFHLDPDRYSRWKQGEYIQDVWPEWTDDERELLVSGTHAACWDELFPEEES